MSFKGSSDRQLLTLVLVTAAAVIAAASLAAEMPQTAGQTAQTGQTTQTGQAGQTGQGQAGRAGQPGQRGAPGQTPAGGRGGGRGRGAIQVMELKTTAWPDGGTVPAKYSQVGHDVSPPLTWSGGPETATSFVLIVHDVDAVTSNAQAGRLDDLLQWMVWNIPGSTHSLPEGMPQGPDLADGSRQISVTGPNYRGPAAPANGPPNHYLFELFALDTTIAIPAVGKAPADTRAAVMAAMIGHVRGKGTLIGVFRRAAVPH